MNSSFASSLSIYTIQPKLCHISVVIFHFIDIECNEPFPFLLFRLSFNFNRLCTLAFAYKRSGQPSWQINITNSETQILDTYRFNSANTMYVILAFLLLFHFILWSWANHPHGCFYMCLYLHCLPACVCIWVCVPYILCIYVIISAGSLNGHSNGKNKHYRSDCT